MRAIVTAGKGPLVVFFNLQFRYALGNLGEASEIQWMTLSLALRLAKTREKEKVGEGIS
jgi:hypothetical protein